MSTLRTITFAAHVHTNVLWYLSANNEHVVDLCGKRVGWSVKVRWMAEDTLASVLNNIWVSILSSTLNNRVTGDKSGVFTSHCDPGSGCMCKDFRDLISKQHLKRSSIKHKKWMIISSKLHNRQQFSKQTPHSVHLSSRWHFSIFHRDKHLSVNAIFVIFSFCFDYLKSWVFKVQRQSRHFC